MAEVNFYLRDNDPDKKTAVMLFFSFKGNRFKVGTVEHIKPKYWDSENQRAKQTKTFPTHPEFNASLNSIRNEVLDIYRKFLNDNHQEQPTPPHIKALIKSKLFPDKSQSKLICDDLISFTDLFIKETETGKRLSERGMPIKPNTIKIYRTFKKNLTDFKAEKKYDLHFENIGLGFFEDFKDYLTFEKKYTTNTLSKHIRTIKTIISEALERGLTKTPFIGKRYKAKTEETETVYLNKAELEAIYNLDLSSEPRLERVRDLFIVGAWTGLRFSDFNDINSKNIDGDFISIKTEKTGKVVVIPIHNFIREIMKKYQGKTENSLPPSISNQKMNEYLKEVAKKAEIKENITLQYTKAGKKIIKTVPKHTLISTHTARRSFATNMFLDNVPTITIMAITGHTTESSFMKYIRVTPTEQAEKLRKHWSEQVILKAVV